MGLENFNRYGSTIIIGGKKIYIDGFEFDQQKLTSNPLLTMMVIIASDPTEKQKEVLDKLEIVVLDDKGKKFYPREVNEQLLNEAKE